MVKLGAKVMIEFRAFPTANSWFKGNLHTHSKISDGRLEPRDVVQLYKEQGWDFLALTEHEIFTHWTEFNDDRFLIIPGIEVGMGAPGRSYHAPDGGTITFASHTLHGDEKYVRVEVIDERGRTAWTNPLFF